MYDPSPSGITMVMDAGPERPDPRLTENLTDFMSGNNETSKKENREEKKLKWRNNEKPYWLSQWKSKHSSYSYNITNSCSSCQRFRSVFWLIFLAPFIASIAHLLGSTARPYSRLWSTTTSIGQSTNNRSYDPDQGFALRLFLNFHVGIS